MNPSSENGCCANGGGPGYASPAEAIKAPREKFLFVTCANTADSRKSDMIASVDVDPASPTYCQLVSQLSLPHVGDEVHHTGWNVCSSCHGDPNSKRSHLVAPCLFSNRIYVIDTIDPKNLSLHKTVESEELKKLNLSFPHTSHCLADGTVLISTLGDADGNGRGSFLSLDGKTFEPKESQWESTPFAYDFWYQPRCDVMISTEWGSPKMIKQGGFERKHLVEGHYGNQVHIWQWSTKSLKQSITLEGPEGWMPLEVRFLHEPTSCHAFLGTGYGSAIYHLYRENADGEFKHRLAVAIPPKRVEGWSTPEMVGLITDVVISMDDRFLYFSNWLQGDVRQYDISDVFNIKLVGRIFLGGALQSGTKVKVVDDPSNEVQPNPLIVKGVKFEGGPQMLQLSLDGKRLYVTNSLYSIADRECYPGLAKNGSSMLQLDVDTERGGLKLNENFFVDFSHLPDGPYLAHEMRYPGGDCTSDIWI